MFLRPTSKLTCAAHHNRVDVDSTSPPMIILNERRRRIYFRCGKKRGSRHICDFSFSAYTGRSAYRLADVIPFTCRWIERELFSFVIPWRIEAKRLSAPPRAHSSSRSIWETAKRNWASLCACVCVCASACKRCSLFFHKINLIIKMIGENGQGGETNAIEKIILIKSFDAKWNLSNAIIDLHVQRCDAKCYLRQKHTN